MSELPHRMTTAFALAELGSDIATVTATHCNEEATTTYTVEKGELKVTQYYHERMIFEGSPSELETAMEVYEAVFRLKQKPDVIKTLSTQKAYPDVEALLIFLRQP